MINRFYVKAEAMPDFKSNGNYQHLLFAYARSNTELYTIGTKGEEDVIARDELKFVDITVAIFSLISAVNTGRYAISSRFLDRALAGLLDGNTIEF